jgi:membrane-associated protease RseP (regulator of RpoE activity)
LKPSNRKGSFTNLPYLKKFYISVAGCVVNIILGTVVGLIGYYAYNYNALYFGFLSIALGLTNLIPLIPCLDGGYLLFFPLCIKIWGKKKGILIFQKIVKVSFKIVMWLNYLCLPWLIWNWRKIC